MQNINGKFVSWQQTSVQFLDRGSTQPVNTHHHEIQGTPRTPRVLPLSASPTEERMDHGRGEKQQAARPLLAPETARIGRKREEEGGGGQKRAPALTRPPSSSLALAPALLLRLLSQPSSARS